VLSRKTVSEFSQIELYNFSLSKSNEPTTTFCYFYLKNYLNGMIE